MDEKILIIDDEPEILNILDMMLTAEGFQAGKASGGRAAIALCQTESFDLAITEIKMPGMDGLEVIKHLKALDQDMEFIVLTGFASLGNSIELLQTGSVSGLLQKPPEALVGVFYTM
jgi:YesN/AraC family two-component response regulator